MKRIFLLVFSMTVIIHAYSQNNITGKSNLPKDYFPSAKHWERKSPREFGFDEAKLNLAIRFAIDQESKNPRSMEESHLRNFGNEPFHEAIGPFADRGNPTGIILYRGYIIAEWGEPHRVDMTHSVTKSFLSIVVGLAVDKGLIRNVNDTVAAYVSSVELYPIQNGTDVMKDPRLIFPFSSAYNRKLTWDVMLRQTSDWEGELWGKPDWADRPDPDSTRWKNRLRNDPGSVFEYNDVRVNALALAATCVWRNPLPQVLKTYIMDPIGSSGSWRWHGYRNSWIVLDGKPVQSVSGGGHWGGGMFINAFDMARFGLLTLHKGKWNGKQIISENWIKKSLIPTAVQPSYGHMNFYLNTGKKFLPAAPATAFAHMGNGRNVIYVDPEHNLVMVLRWIENNAVDDMVGKVLEALK